jgi:hypothetical protein
MAAGQEDNSLIKNATDSATETVNAIRAFEIRVAKEQRLNTQLQSIITTLVGFGNDIESRQVYISDARQLLVKNYKRLGIKI